MDQVALGQLMASQSCCLVAAAVRHSVRQMLEAVMDLATALEKENEAAPASSRQEVRRSDAANRPACVDSADAW